MLGVLGPATPAGAAGPTGADAKRSPTGRAIVLLERGTGSRSAPGGQARRGLASIRGLLAPTGARLEGAVPELGVAVVSLSEGETLPGLRAKLSSSAAVAGVEPEYRRSFRLIPDDPLYGATDRRAPGRDDYQWFLREHRFEVAWELSTGSGARVAIIDSGVDGTNPDLAGRVVHAAERVPGPSSATEDEEGHGTHVAGLACAASGNGYGGASSGFGCELIAEKIDLRDATIVAAIHDSVENGADVINMSFGGSGRSRAVRRAIQFAWKRDVVMVAAASNRSETDQGVPARYLQRPGTGPRMRRGKGLVVTAAGYDNRRAFFGPGRGNGVSMAAYGVAVSSRRPKRTGILSSFPAEETVLERGTTRFPPCRCRATIDGDDRFAYLSGTSEAAPQVAGAAALMRARNPAITARRTIRLLKRTARGSRFRPRLGWGILDAGTAVRKAGA